MKEKIKTILLQNPNITLPEAARVLGRNPQGDKNFRIAYWQARALLIEELTGKTLRAILDEGPKDNIDEGHIIDTGSIDNEGHINNEGHIGSINSMDHMNEGHINHSVSEEGDHTVSNFDIYDF